MFPKPNSQVSESEPLHLDRLVKSITSARRSFKVSFKNTSVRSLYILLNDENTHDPLQTPVGALVRDSVSADLMHRKRYKRVTQLETKLDRFEIQATIR